MTLKLHFFILPKPSQFFGGCPEDENDAGGLPRNVGQVVRDYMSSCPTAERAWKDACFNIASV